MTIDDDERRRSLARRRAEDDRDRRRRGAVLVTMELDPHDPAALERSALPEPGDRDPHRLACAAARFLAVVPAVAALGDAPWPEGAPMPGAVGPPG